MSCLDTRHSKQSLGNLKVKRFHFYWPNVCNETLVNFSLESHMMEHIVLKVCVKAINTKRLSLFNILVLAKSKSTYLSQILTLKHSFLVLIKKGTSLEDENSAASDLERDILFLFQFVKCMRKEGARPPPHFLAGGGGKGGRISLKYSL